MMTSRYNIGQCCTSLTRSILFIFLLPITLSFFFYCLLCGSRSRCNTSSGSVFFPLPPSLLYHMMFHKRSVFVSNLSCSCILLFLIVNLFKKIYEKKIMKKKVYEKKTVHN